ncbi:MAG: thermonuclease family protein [Hyphomicrobiaceae bacterium]
MREPNGWLFAVTVMLLGACIATGGRQVRAQASAPLPCALDAGPARAVVAIGDGHSVTLDDGVDLRLLGILAPTARDGGPWPAARPASVEWPPSSEAQRVLEKLVGGRSVALAFAGPHTDRYGRVVAHLFVDVDGRQIWVQGYLVERGQARAHPLPRHPNPCHAALVALERRARAAGLGLWSHAAYQIRPADRPSELARYRYTFQLVRGRVERTRTTRALVILELANGEAPPAPAGRSHRNAFHVIWRRGATGNLKLPDTGSLVGRNILVRGWVDEHRGPEIELVAAGQIEFED